MITYKTKVTDIEIEYSQLEELHKKKFKTKPQYIVACPARFELIGHHLDYLQGETWCGAMNLYDTIGISLRDDHVISLMVQTAKDDSIELEVKSDELPFILKAEDTPVVFKYMLQAINSVQKFQPETIGGFNMSAYLDIPYGAGLGSSAALSIGIIQCLNAVNNLQLNNETIVELCKCTERALGVACGNLDIVAELSSRQNRVGLCNAVTGSLTNMVALSPNDYEFLIIDFLQPHENIKSGLVELIAEHKELEQLLDKKLDIPGSQESTSILNDRILSGYNLDFLSYREKSLLCRANNEARLVEAFKLQANAHMLTPKSLGKLMNASYENSQILGNITSLQAKFVKYANCLKGVLGIKAHGAGFGGSLLMLIDSKKFTCESLEMIDQALLGLQDYVGMHVYKVQLVNGAIHQAYIPAEELEPKSGCCGCKQTS